MLRGFRISDSGIPVLSNPFYTLEKVMIHKAGESEEATPLCFKDCALKIGLERTRFQIILMNADHFRHFSLVSYCPMPRRYLIVKH
jgi:hypothetical protein